MRAVGAGLVSREVALENASSPHDFKLMLAAHGRRHSGIEQLVGAGNEPADGPGPHNGDEPRANPLRAPPGVKPAAPGAGGDGSLAAPAPPSAPPPGHFSS